MNVDLSRREIDYLRSLVRRNARQHAREMAKGKPGDPLTAAKRQESLAFAIDTYRTLGGRPDDLGLPRRDDESFMVDIGTGMTASAERQSGVDTSRPDDHGIVRRLP